MKYCGRPQMKNEKYFSPAENNWEEDEPQDPENNLTFKLLGGEAGDANTFTLNIYTVG